MKRDFTEFLERKGKEYPNDKFNPSDLSKQFIPYYNSQERIKVQFPHGEIKTGTVGVTTGWRPVFLLILTSRSLGSSYTLSDNDRIIAVKYGNSYISR